MKDISARIKQLQSANVPRMKWTDVFIVKDGAQPLSEDAEKRLNKYFESFAELPKNTTGERVCFGCGQRFLSDMLMSAILGGMEGNTSWEWSLVHGECHCRVCGWPARAYRYDIGGKGEDALIKRLNMPLAVHPSLLEVSETAEAVDPADGISK